MAVMAARSPHSTYSISAIAEPPSLASRLTTRSGSFPARSRGGLERHAPQGRYYPDPGLIRHGAHLRSAPKQMTLELLALAEPPKAIVAASDVQAVGVIEAAEALHLKVPDDLSIIGYDDIDLA